MYLQAPNSGDLAPFQDFFSTLPNVTYFAWHTRGLSQEELAHRADASRGHMGKVENAKFATSIGLFERIARAHNVDPEELFSKR